MPRPKGSKNKPKKKAPEIRTDPNWDDSDYVNVTKLNKRQKEELAEDPSSPMQYANVYDPSDYSAPVETFDNEYNPDEYFDIWGKFEPTFYQYDWYELLIRRMPRGIYLSI